MVGVDQVRALFVKDLGLDGLPEEMQNEIIGEIAESVMRKVTLSVLEHLPDEKQEEFAKLTESEDTSKMAVFLNEHIPNLNDLVRAEVKREFEEFKKIRDSL